MKTANDLDAVVKLGQNKKYLCCQPFPYNRNYHSQMHVRLKFVYSL